MEQILLLVGTSFLLTFLIFPIFIKILKKKDFLDDPGGRKIHTIKTPAMGGLPIFLGFVTSLLLWLSFSELGEIKYVLSSVIIMFVIGFRDDLINLRAYQKLLGQIAAALIIVAVSDVRLTSLYGLFGIYDIHISISYLLSIFTIIVITNAYNLIDGIDGLAGSVGLIASLFFGTWFYVQGNVGFAALSLALCGALAAFLNFNWAPSKIFMGDTGSLFIGFFLSILAIAFIDANFALQGSPYTFGGSIGTALAILIVPLADTLRVFIRRILKGRSPMHPDRTHTHHILLRLKCNHAQATGILVTVNIFFVLLALVLRQLSDAVVVPVIVFTALVLSKLLDFIFSSTIKKRKELLKAENRKGRKEGKVVPLGKSAS
jgi:UDP-GlcNAc:undecaprenyl-phosphate GlcNAc-1-phosphate transferase